MAQEQLTVCKFREIPRLKDDLKLPWKLYSHYMWGFSLY